ncbi:D-amino-acid oxidase [Rhodofomes roseus]|uniref:D-amino-acid oxidase n=1 Tax=Rhodofomes roseus TaxID=34475 RepID=A0ABQ8KCW6_9APHY|nr:D-amino-acid oxidase [Rhodofomes roseus]KAH9835408.1 D-amino-acid oxidase [Rhodofomes roseus]
MSKYQREERSVVVLGAGVTGLTTALAIQEKGGYEVSVIAETLPSDPKRPEYTSPWAGAHQALHTGQDERDRRLEQDTFSIMWELAGQGSPAEHCLRRITEREYFRDELDFQTHWMPDFRQIPSDSLVSNAQRGYAYSTYTVDPPLYLNYLLSRFLARGGTVVRGKVQHVSQVLEGGIDVFNRGRASTTPVDALIVCAGLGARTLGGVEDEAVYPNRGQVILLKAPWITEACRISDSTGGDQTYVIPRQNGVVSMGSTKSPNDWFPIARPETTDDILQRCLALCPELVPLQIRAERSGTIEDLRPLIVEAGCGFRPARQGGIRLKSEWVQSRGTDDKKLVVYNYGHAGKGYVTSWACAAAVIDMLEAALMKD